jgi:uridine phosphorylase
MMPPGVTIHIRPTAALAERVLLPEDPGAAMALAQALVERPLMFNHSRGLWGYTGAAADGAPLTVQSTGMGGPSAAIVLDELIELGLRRAVRVGTCAGLAPGLELGALLVAEGALAADGTSRALGAGARVEGDPVLTAGLRRAGPHAGAGVVASTDLFRGAGDAARWAGGGAGASWRSAGAVAVDLETAAVFALAAARGVAVGCVLVVADVLAPPRRIADDALAAAAERAARLGLAALGPSP